MRYRGCPSTKIVPLPRWLVADLFGHDRGRWRWFSMYNKAKLDKFAEGVRKQTEKYGLPTAPKKPKKKKKAE